MLVLLLIKIIDKNFVTSYLWSNFDVPLILSKPWFVNIVHPDFIHPEAHLINKRLILFYKIILYLILLSLTFFIYIF